MSCCLFFTEILFQVIVKNDDDDDDDDDAAADDDNLSIFKLEAFKSKVLGFTNTFAILFLVSIPALTCGCTIWEVFTKCPSMIRTLFIPYKVAAILVCKINLD